jgi:hypothetical protein
VTPYKGDPSPKSSCRFLVLLFRDAFWCRFFLQLSFMLGCMIFPSSAAMQLGLFFTGISPSGGASNLYVCMFNGNLNLSVAITALGNLFAFCKYLLVLAYFSFQKIFRSIPLHFSNTWVRWEIIILKHKIIM